MSAITNQQIYDASITVGTTAEIALAANPQRQFLDIQNVHATQNVGYTLNGTTPVIGQAGTFVLTPYQEKLLDTFVVTGAVTVIGSGSGTPVTINYC